MWLLCRHFSRMSSLSVEFQMSWCFLPSDIIFRLSSDFYHLSAAVVIMLSFMYVSQIITVESWDKTKRPFPAFWAVSSIGWVAGFDQRGTWFESRSLHYKKSLSYYMYQGVQGGHHAGNKAHFERKWWVNFGLKYFNNTKPQNDDMLVRRCPAHLATGHIGVSPFGDKTFRDGCFVW